MTAPSMRSPLDRATWRLLRDRGGSPRAADIIERHHADVWHAAQAEVRAVLAALDPPSPGMLDAAEAVELEAPDTATSRDVLIAQWAAMLAAVREGA